MVVYRYLVADDGEGVVIPCAVAPSKDIFHQRNRIWWQTLRSRLLTEVRPGTLDQPTDIFSRWHEYLLLHRYRFVSEGVAGLEPALKPYLPSRCSCYGLSLPAVHSLIAVAVVTAAAIVATIVRATVSGVAAVLFLSVRGRGRLGDDTRALQLILFFLQ